MARLNHVCMWNGKQWQRITAEEAGKKFPYTVSAESHIFICELCGQSVILTSGDKRIRYFKHNRGEDEKNCPDRSGNTGYETFKNGDHGLPLKIVFDDDAKKRFHFELGMIPVPQGFLINVQNRQIKIFPRENESPYVYNFERINPDTVTYLDVGNLPYEQYSVEVDSRLKKYWPETIKGPSPKGSLFDGKTGKLLIPDSEVTAHKDYYFLKLGSQKSYDIPKDIFLKFVCKQNDFYLYTFRCSLYNEDTARYLWKLHYRLTDRPVSIQPIWPLYRETPYTITHNRDYTYFFINGNNESEKGSGIRTEIYPMPEHPVQPKKQGSITLLKVPCKSDRVMISAGRSKVLTFRYFYRRKMDETADIPPAEVRDGKGNRMEQTIYTRLPAQKILIISAPYDGKVRVRDGHRVLVYEDLKSGQAFSQKIDRLGVIVEILQGLDVVFKIEFKKKKQSSTRHEKRWIELLDHCSGDYIPFGRHIALATARLENMPKLRHWVMKCVKSGYIREDALRIIQSILFSRK